MPNSKTKGHSFERDIAKILRAIFPNVKTSRLMNRDADNRGIDLVNTGDWAFQCKRYARKYPNLEEALDMQTDAEYRAVIHKRDRKDILVTMELGEFLKILHDQKAS